MGTTPGHQAVIRYILEVTPGTTPSNPALLLFSPEVQNVKWGLDVNLKESRDIGSLDIHDYYSVMNSYSCEVEMNLYDMARLEGFFTRQTDGTVRSYTLEVIPNRDAGGSNVVYFRGVGWKPQDVVLKGDTENAYTVTIKFEGGKWAAPVTTDPGIGTGSRELPAAFTGANAVIKTFADAAITLDAAPVGTLLNSIEVSINHGVTIHHNTGTKDPEVAVAVSGPRTIKGSGDVSMDAGYKTMWDRVVAGASHTLVVPFGTASASRVLTLTGVFFPKIDAEVNVDSDLLMAGQEFTALSLAFSAVP